MYIVDDYSDGSITIYQVSYMDEGCQRQIQRRRKYKNEKRINARIIKYKTIQTITYFINGKQCCRYSLSFTTNRN